MANLITIAPQTEKLGDLSLVITMAGPGEGGLHVSLKAMNGHLVYAGSYCQDNETAVHEAALKVARGDATYAADAVEERLRRLIVPAEGAYLRAAQEQRYKRRGKDEEEGPDPQPWPDPLAAAAWHGLAGDITRVIEPHTEADPVAVLLTVLSFLGNDMGHSPHMRISGARHTTNENVVIVGPSAKARKGSSLGHPVNFMRLLDPLWVKTRKLSGLSSGEGLVNNVRDATTGTGKDGENIAVDAGETDKRLMIVEPEFAAVLRTASREGNTLSTYIRQAWDDGNLGVLTRRNPLIATDAHISILGHATRQDLDKCLADEDAWNGFANRFLWICARRSKLLSRGGGEPVYGDLVPRTYAMLEAARNSAEVVWGDEAGALWDRLYAKLTRERAGRLAAATSRGEAHVVRLAVLYAALDMSTVIEMEHLQAALAIWHYAEQSARWLFGDDGAAEEAATILEALRVAGDDGMNRTALYALFDGHISKASMHAALEQLLTSGAIALAKQASDKGKGGRPATLYRITREAR